MAATPRSLGCSLPLGGLLLGFGLLLIHPARAEEKPATETERFTRFVDWPREALGRQHPYFVLCIAGRGAVVAQLARMARDRPFKDRPVDLRRVQSGDPADRCHLLFIASDEEPRLSELRRLTAGRPILTIGDTPGFAERGVLINMYVGDNHLRFELNVEAVKRSQLVFSSQLLRLARLVGQ